MKRRLNDLLLVAVVTGTVAVSAVALYPFSRAAELRRNLDLARLHAERVQPVLREDGRFGFVRLSPLAKDRGVMLCSGSVETEADYLALRRAVLETRPPVPVVWEITIRSPSKDGGSSM
ncbi:MAG: hypothetical protein ACK4PI_09285 [Tepidisphaerales bacterium]